MKQKPVFDARPIAGAPRDARREPRRGDLFKLADGSMLRVGSPSVRVERDGAEIPCFDVESVGTQSKHTHDVLSLQTVRARVAAAVVLHCGPPIADPWRSAPRNRSDPDDPMAR